MNMNADIKEKEVKLNTIYLAGGCFWGMERLMQVIKGVVTTTCGYANGKSENLANYQDVCTGKTGFKETVKVDYDPSVVSLHTLLFAFFKVIDPTLIDRQGNDIGPQYQSGIYYVDEASKAIVDDVVAVEKKRVKKFNVEIQPLTNFYEAEQYHQDYLLKNPKGYCHINLKEIQEAANILIDAGRYQRPNEEMIKQKLTQQQFHITQDKGTEPPFSSAYHSEKGQGIYVDIVTGEPLFSSLDKYISSCGWPSFSKPIDPNVINEADDNSLFLQKRTEVLSRTGNSHLGHVFDNDPESPNGIRYCINGGALRFIPIDQMDEEGYGYLLSLFNEGKE